MLEKHVPSPGFHVGIRSNEMAVGDWLWVVSSDCIPVIPGRTATHPFYVKSPVYSREDALKIVAKWRARGYETTMMPVPGKRAD